MSDTMIVAACDDEWSRRIMAFSGENRTVQYDQREIRLQNPDLIIIRVKHPSMIQGRFTKWNLWCCHHLSAKQLDRLEEKLPEMCAPTSPFED